MRQALLRGLGRALAVKNRYLLTADTGFRVLDALRLQYPQRVLNVGICEAAMISAAAGLALCGKQVLVYGIAPFVTLRCLDQIRVDLCAQRLPVTIIGVGGGLTYAAAGMTHHSIEDVAAMTALPEMTVVCPGDPLETEAAVDAAMGLQGPCYLRIGKSGERCVHTRPPEGFTIGRAISMSPGRQVALISTGCMLGIADETCAMLRSHGLEPELVSMHTVKPLDEDMVLSLARRCRLLATLEEHNVIGGLGSMVSRVLATGWHRVRLRTFGIPDQYAAFAGDQQFLRKRYGLTPECIAASLLSDVSLAERKTPITVRNLDQ